MRRSNFRAASVLFIGLMVLLAGCPNEVEVVSEGGEDYIAAAVLVNEKAKYETAVVFEFDENDADTDVTGQVIQLLPGKSANRDVTVSISGAAEGNYFSLDNGRLSFIGLMPPSKDGYETARSDLESEIEKETDAGKKADLQALLHEMDRVTNNTEVITLTFQKDGTTAKLDVLAVVNRKGETKPERNVADVVSSFLIYGYDVINSGYINRNDVKRGAPILDAAKVDAGGLLVHDTTATSSTWTSSSGESVVDLLTKINAAASVEYKAVLFSGKVEVEFSTSSSSKTTTRYAKGQGFHVAREDFLAKSTARSLKNYLDDDFIADINSESAAYILRTYGTHLLTGCLLGGEAEFNYSYHGTELNDDMKITAALNATFGSSFTASASGSYESQKAELRNNSVFTSSSRGGDNTAFTTAEEFMNKYSTWVASVTAKPDLCGIPSFERLLPIWELAEQVNPAKADAIKAEFLTMVYSRGIALEGYKPVIAGSLYVTDILAQENTAELPAGYTFVRTDPLSVASNPGVLNANSGNSGVFIVIPYKMDNSNKHDAIAEIQILKVATTLDSWLKWAMSATSATPATPATPVKQGWTVIPFDLNKGAGGLLDTYLAYRKVNQYDTQAIDFIGGVVGYSEPNDWGYQVIFYNKTIPIIQNAPNYEWVNDGTETYTKDGVPRNLNYGESGGNLVYLSVHKSPFTW